jgi:hypothetical protein
MLDRGGAALVDVLSEGRTNVRDILVRQRNSDFLRHGPQYPDNRGGSMATQLGLTVSQRTLSHTCPANRRGLSCVFWASVWSLHGSQTRGATWTATGAWLSDTATERKKSGGLSKGCRHPTRAICSSKLPPTMTDYQAPGAFLISRIGHIQIASHAAAASESRS